MTRDSSGERPDIHHKGMLDHHWVKILLSLIMLGYLHSGEQFVEWKVNRDTVVGLDCDGIWGYIHSYMVETFCKFKHIFVPGNGSKWL